MSTREKVGLRALVPASVRAQRALAAVIAVVVVLLAAVIALGRGASEEPPATGAAAIVPADALAYVHLSTDAKRPAVKRALALAARFPDYPLLRLALQARPGAITTASGTAAGLVDFTREIRPWLGKEAAIALLGTSSSAASSLIVLDVGDRAAARRFLARVGPVRHLDEDSQAILRLPDGTELAFLGHYLTIGQDEAVRAAIDTGTGRAPSLAASTVYRRAEAGEPAGRALDAYASVQGARALLAPRSGLVGALGALVNQPALAGVAVAFTPSSSGLSIRVHSVLDPRLAYLRGRALHPFSPSLASEVPSGAALLLDTTGLDRAAPRLLGAGAAGGYAGVGPLLSRLGTALQAEGVDVKRDVLSLFEGETAIAIAPGAGRPALVVIARTSNENRTRTALAELEAPLAQLFPLPASGPGQAPVFTDQQVDGITAHQLALAPGLEFDYAVFDGKVVIATSLAAIAAVRDHARSLIDDDRYQATLGDRPEAVTSLLFLDFDQLLSLGEQTGLTRSARYRALRADLQRIRAIGLQSSSGEADSTAELFLQIS